MNHLVGANLRTLRTAAGLTQPQLAERAGIEQGYLSKLENGRAAPSQEVLERLAAALAVTPAQLTAPTATAPRSRMMVVFGALLGVAAVAVGLLMASPDEPVRPEPAPGAPFSLVAALDAAPEGVDVQVLAGGEPGAMLTIRGKADSELAVREYLDVLSPYGRAHVVEFDPRPWWRLGGVEFQIMLRIPEQDDT